MKVIDATETRTEPPLAMAGRIAEEIRRAITGPQETSEQPGGNELVEQEDIISLADAKKRTGYLEQLGYSIKKLVWS
jgi:hypothetical protein